MFYLFKMPYYYYYCYYERSVNSVSGHNMFTIFICIYRYYNLFSLKTPFLSPEIHFDLHSMYTVQGIKVKRVWHITECIWAKCLNVCHFIGSGFLKRKKIGCVFYFMYVLQNDGKNQQVETDTEFNSNLNNIRRLRSKKKVHDSQ